VLFVIAIGRESLQWVRAGPRCYISILANIDQYRRTANSADTLL
jgi:hypothetical protein